MTATTPGGACSRGPECRIHMARTTLADRRIRTGFCPFCAAAGLPALMAATPSVAYDIGIPLLMHIDRMHPELVMTQEEIARERVRQMFSGPGRALLN
jgi:hypothetical protein